MLVRHPTQLLECHQPYRAPERVLSITDRIDSLAKPVRVAGRLDWRNEPVDVDPADTLLAGNFASEGIPLKLQVKMPDANLSLDGKAAPTGRYAGKLDFSTADFSALLAGLGQSGAESIGAR